MSETTTPGVASTAPGVASTAPGVAEAVDGLREEVAQLRDLFVRRLAEDRARASLYATVQDQLRESQELLRSRALESLVLELLLAIDRLRDEPVSEALVDSAVDEVLEAFARRQVLPVEHDGGFDARFHEAVATVPADERTPVGSVVVVHRDGYRIGDRLLRPSRVTIAVAPRTTAADDGAVGV
ncbi:nucleotide exchange factor GrpE [Curtobacterium pusillum]|uniref:Nucleotide exchange factor GrpE n=1 Tax=Curtobacterium pusillum TaxID=69373 RepID=A0ABX2M6P2_9MICO|nr:nucleotide exchange factor GrpE [Curtobacterium pusillum]NUU13754.1 nucleotide exchange factor GrpE [Curtobacterium pusillum]GLK30362.1 protein GrpE [Curtobacterium pusillum]